MMRAQTFGAGPDLVMLPGWSMTGAVWPDLAERLSRDWRVTLVDLPGHGANAAVPFEQVDAAERVAACVPPGAVWLGWSLGGQVALQAAASGAAVRALILLAATPRFTAAPDWPHGVSAQELDDLRRQVDRDPERARAGFVALLARGGADSRRAAGHLRRALRTAAFSATGLRSALDWLAETDLRPALPSIVQPAWWLNGDEDPLAAPPTGPSASALMPRGQFGRLQGSGHVPFLTHADAIVSTLEQARTIIAP